MMRRALEVLNGVAVAEWRGEGPIPEPAPPRVMVDVTEQPTAQVGDYYDPAFGEFIPPERLDYGQTVDARTFQLLFTQAERVAIRQAAASNAGLADWARLAELPLPIRLKHPTTQAGLAALIAAGLLTEARAAAISDGTPPDED